MSTLDDVRAEMAAYDSARARSMQVATGASGIYGCRAQTLLRLAGVPQSDPGISWQALVGTAIHNLAERSTPAHVLTEQRFEYRGVPCTIDRYSNRTLTDYKTKDEAEDIAKIRRNGPDESEIAQVQIGAAALIAAGYEVDTVELLYLPRSGNLDSAYLWSAPFDRAKADAAAEWSMEQDARAADVAARGLDVTLILDGLRDKPEFVFCRDYCEWVSVCRGPERSLLDNDDPFIIAAAEEYATGKALEARGKAIANRARPLINGLRANCGPWKVTTSGGNQKTATEVDVDAALEVYREFIGDPPMKTVEKTTAVTVRVTPIKPAASPLLALDGE